MAPLTPGRAELCREAALKRTYGETWHAIGGRAGLYILRVLQLAEGVRKVVCCALLVYIAQSYLRS
jgi:hypothetical protein